jgi:hypothetical protein
MLDTQTSHRVEDCTWLVIWIRTAISICASSHTPLEYATFSVF